MSCVYLQTASWYGTSVVPVRIEVDLQPGLPYFSIIGLPDKQIAEAKDRVRAALKNGGYTFPLGKITVNLSPSYLQKQGTGFDLGIALGVLQVSRQIPQLKSNTWLIGELSLDGIIRKAPKLLGILIEAIHRKVGCLIPEQNREEAVTAFECQVEMANSLQEAVNKITKGLQLLPSQPRQKIDKAPTHNSYLLDSIIGQAGAKRALEIALAGGHNLFLTGPPGSGKTMLALAAQELLPSLPRDQALEVARVYSLANEKYEAYDARPPLRTPHHGITAAGLLGGFRKPGEISLAQHGILFLDEIARMPSRTKENLLEPMQSREIQLRKNGMLIRYPASCQIIAAQNPCHCGLYGVEHEACRCTAGELNQYSRIHSEAFLDRFDIFCDVPKVSLTTWNENSPSQTSQMIKRLIITREIQMNRQGSLNSQTENIISPELVDYCHELASKIYLSARGVQKISAVARTIADLAGDDKLTRQHMQEAVQYRYRPINRA